MSGSSSLTEQDRSRTPPEVRFAEADDPLLSTAAPETVRDATLAGARWGAMARVGIEALSFLSSVVLARLVDPTGFGHAATALGVIALASSLTIEGFGTPLVQRRQLARAHVEA